MDHYSFYRNLDIEALEDVIKKAERRLEEDLETTDACDQGIQDDMQEIDIMKEVLEEKYANERIN
jgi:hypothetical protein